jgi:hypothetical protein
MKRPTKKMMKWNLFAFIFYNIVFFIYTTVLEAVPLFATIISVVVILVYSILWAIYIFGEKLE